MPNRKKPKLSEIYAAIDSIIDPVLRQIQRTRKEALDDIRKLLGRLYEKYADSDGVLTHAEMTRYNRLKALHDQLTEELGPMFGRDGKLIGNLTKVVYEETYYRMGWYLTQNAEAAGSWGLLNPKLIEAAVNKPYSGLVLPQIWTRAKAGALSDIERAIIRGAVQGESYPKMARRVREVFDTNTRRALTIAQTEAHRMQTEGQKASYDEAADMGIEVQQVWDATLDNRTRETHQTMDGRIAEYDESDGQYWFNSPDVGWVLGPGLSGEPSFDINCRCRVTPVIKGYEPKTRGRREGGEWVVGEYMTYPEWAEAQGVR